MYLARGDSLATLGQIRGMMLEEIVLFLLSRNGYNVVEDPTSDPFFLKRDRGGLWVKGRGGWHQIDAIADYNFSAPFSFRQRILVEAKCLSDKVGLEVIRNSVGTHKDLSEVFIPTENEDGMFRNRYHYQSAVFSSSGFTHDAQGYAYAQDIFLLDLNAGAFKRIVSILNQMKQKDIPTDMSLSELRRRFRNFLRGNGHDGGYDQSNRVPRLKDMAHRINCAFVSMIGGVFPLFLIPGSDFFSVNKLNDILTNIEIDCSIHINNDEFSIRKGNLDLFYFRLPHVLFKKCFDNGTFDQINALNLKERYLSELEVSWFVGKNTVKKMTLKLDRDWLQRIRNSLHE